MKNDSITKEYLDEKFSSIDRKFSGIDQRFDSLEKGLGDMKENIFEFIENVQHRFDEAQADRDEIKKQIREIMLFEVGGLKKDVKVLDDRLSFIETTLAIPK